MRPHEGRFVTKDLYRPLNIRISPRAGLAAPHCAAAACPQVSTLSWSRWTAALRGLPPSGCMLRRLRSVARIRARWGRGSAAGRVPSGDTVIPQAEASMAGIHGTHILLRPCERHENGTLRDAEYEQLAEAALREVTAWPTASRPHWLEAGALSHWAPAGVPQQDAAVEARRAAVLMRLAANSGRFGSGAFAHGLRVLVSQEAAALLGDQGTTQDARAVWVLRGGAVARSDDAVPPECGVPGPRAAVDLPFARRGLGREAEGEEGAALVEVGGGVGAGGMARAQAASYDESLAAGLAGYTAAAAYAASQHKVGQCLELTDALDGVTLEYFSGDVQANPRNVCVPPAA